MTTHDRILSGATSESSSLNKPSSQEGLNTDEARKILCEMRALEDVYGKVFLEKSMHDARYQYDELKRRLRSLKLPDYRGGEAKTAESGNCPSIEGARTK